MYPYYNNNTEKLKRGKRKYYLEYHIALRQLNNPQLFNNMVQQPSARRTIIDSFYLKPPTPAEPQSPHSSYHLSPSGHNRGTKEKEKSTRHSKQQLPSRQQNNGHPQPPQKQPVGQPSRRRVPRFPKALIGPSTGRAAGLT